MILTTAWGYMAHVQENADGQTIFFFCLTPQIRQSALFFGQKLAFRLQTATTMDSERGSKEHRHQAGLSDSYAPQPRQPVWLHDRQLIVHDKNCENCNRYRDHYYDAEIAKEPALLRAQEEQHEHWRLEVEQSSSLLRALRTQVEDLHCQVDGLQRSAIASRRTILDLEVERDGLHNQLTKFRQQLENHVREATFEGQLERARQPPPSVIPSTSVIAGLSLIFLVLM